MVDFHAMLKRNQETDELISKLDTGIMMLPYEERTEAYALVKKWGMHRRLSQMERLKLDNFLTEIKKKVH